MIYLFKNYIIPYDIWYKKLDFRHTIWLPWWHIKIYMYCTIQCIWSLYTIVFIRFIDYINLILGPFNCPQFTFLGFLRTHYHCHFFMACIIYFPCLHVLVKNLFEEIPDSGEPLPLELLTSINSSLSLSRRFLFNSWLSCNATTLQK